MKHPIPTQEFKEKLIKIIKNNDSKLKDKNVNDLIEKLYINSDNHPSKPGKPNLKKIKATTEVAFQRGIYNSKNTCLIKIENSLEETNRIDWLDIELPVVLSKKSRRPCIDIIGLNKDKLVLCELKYTKTNAKTFGDNPMYAVFELLIYYYFIRINFKKLDEFKIFHELESNKNFNWEKYLKNSVPLLIVTANDYYWKYWLRTIDNKTKLLNAIRNLKEELQIEIQLFKTEDENYANQSNGNPYQPKVTSNIWTKICN